jgi:hypothetical protein
MDEDETHAEIRIGRFKLGPAYSGDPAMVGIYTTSGEGGDFPVDALEAVIAQFYKDHF